MDLDSIGPTLVRDPLIGQSVRGYTVRRLLGGGGMALVYEAEAFDGRTAALKLLRREWRMDPTQCARLREEARNLRQLHHPFVVRVLDSGELEDGGPLVLMERLQGETLEELVRRRGPLEWRRAAAVLAQVAEALAIVHAVPIVHRDLKSSNVFLCTDGTVKLIDFGLSKLLAPQRARLTAGGVTVGTPQTIAPEQARGALVDERADLYSLGGLAFHVLTGRAVFEGQSASDQVKSHVLVEAPRAATLVERIPPWLDDLVASLLEKEPAKRPQSASMVAQTIRSSLEPRRPNPLAQELGVLLGSVLLLGGVLLLGDRPSPLEAPRVVAPLPTVEPPSVSSPPNLEALRARLLERIDELEIGAGPLRQRELFARYRTQLKAARTADDLRTIQALLPLLQRDSRSRSTR